jgi:hypothetical protein
VFFWWKEAAGKTAVTLAFKQVSAQNYTSTQG